MGPHAPCFAWHAAPRGGFRALGRPGGESVAPTLTGCAWFVAPRGGFRALGRPGGAQVRL
jgi:hypothetical protein